MRDFNNTKPATQNKYGDDTTFLFKFYNFSVKNKHTEMWTKFNAFVNIKEDDLIITARVVGYRDRDIVFPPKSYSDFLDEKAKNKYEVDYQDEAVLLLSHIKEYLMDCDQLL